MLRWIMSLTTVAVAEDVRQEQATPLSSSISIDNENKPIEQDTPKQLIGRALCSSQYSERLQNCFAVPGDQKAACDEHCLTTYGTCMKAYGLEAPK
jgi:hypothetical protein